VALEVGAVGVQVLGVRQPVRLRLAAMDEQQLVSAVGELVDGRATDEARPAQYRYSH